MKEYKQCAWKQIVELLTSPDGKLKTCNYDCDGYDLRCTAYAKSITDVIGFRPSKLEDNVENEDN